MESDERGAEPQEEIKHPFEELDPRVRQDVEGLLYVGYLEDEVSFCGHTFGIRTLKGDEDLNAGLAAKRYIDTPGMARAWAWAKVGLSLMHVDGDYEFCPPIGPDKGEFAKARFAYVSSRWHWPTGEYLYTNLVALEARAIEAIQAVQDLREGNLLDSMPFVGSSTEQGDSAES